MVVFLSESEREDVFCVFLFNFLPSSFSCAFLPSPCACRLSFGDRTRVCWGWCPFCSCGLLPSLPVFVCLQKDERTRRQHQDTQRPKMRGRQKKKKKVFGCCVACLLIKDESRDDDRGRVRKKEDSSDPDTGRKRGSLGKVERFNSTEAKRSRKIKNQKSV